MNEAVSRVIASAAAVVATAFAVARAKTGSCARIHGGTAAADPASGFRRCPGLRTMPCGRAEGLDRIASPAGDAGSDIRKRSRRFFGGAPPSPRNATKSHFLKRDGKFVVQTDGPERELTSYEIAYTIGVTPLQQYLVAFLRSCRWPGIRARPRRQTLVSSLRERTDQLHWTGIYQNWNLQCAECHSTNLHNYSPATSSYSGSPRK